MVSGYTDTQSHGFQLVVISLMSLTSIGYIHRYNDTHRQQSDIIIIIIIITTTLSASELYRRSDSRLPAKPVPTFCG
jgi:hypothetical protein